MKKNSACNIWFLAGIFFLVSQQIFCDGQADTETTLNHHDSTPVSSFDTFAPDNALFPINVDRFGSRSQVVQTSEEKGGDVSLEGSALSELMDQIEKSLEEVESAVKVPVLLSAPAGPVEPIIPLPLTILTKSAEKGPEKPSAPSVPDKPKEKEPEKPPMPDDVDMTPRELDVLHAIDDQTLLTPEKGNNILFNASMPLTGSMALVGRDYLTGINLVFDKFNRSGGLEKKYLLKYSTIDDRYISTEAKINVLKSAKSSPFFVGNFGSHLLATVKNLIEKNEVLMLFPTAGDRAFRNKNYKYLLNLRPSMNAELKALIKYAINSQHRKKIAVFYEENQWGKAGLAAVESILANFGLTICAKANYPSNTNAVIPAATEIIKSRPDAVICISTYRPTYNFIQLVLNEGFQHCLFLGLGPATPMQQLLKKSRGVTIATTSVVPDPVKSKLPIVEAYRRDMVRYFPLRELSQYSLEGYIAGSIFISALKQLEAPYTVGKLVSFFEGLKRKDFGGFKINFNPDTRELSSRVWINKGNQDDVWDDSFSE